MLVKKEDSLYANIEVFFFALLHRFLVAPKSSPVEFL